jgi:hypothetical protein
MCFIRLSIVALFPLMFIATCDRCPNNTKNNVELFAKRPVDINSGTEENKNKENRKRIFFQYQIWERCNVIL